MEKIFSTFDVVVDEAVAVFWVKADDGCAVVYQINPLDSRHQRIPIQHIPNPPFNRFKQLFPPLPIKAKHLPHST